MVGEAFYMFLSVTWPVWLSAVLARLSFGSLKVKKNTQFVRPDINDLIERSKSNSTSQSEKEQAEEINIPQQLPLPYDAVRKDNQPHVLDTFKDHIRGKVDTALQNLFTRDGEIVTVAGLVCKVSVFKTKVKDEYMATGVIEDPSGRAEITLYPQTWLAHPLDENDIVLVCGRVKTGKILVNSLEKIGEVPFV